jgi:hypothetical protein
MSATPVHVNMEKVDENALITTTGYFWPDVAEEKVSAVFDRTGQWGGWRSFKLAFGVQKGKFRNKPEKLNFFSVEQAELTMEELFKYTPLEDGYEYYLLISKLPETLDGFANRNKPEDVRYYNECVERYHFKMANRQHLSSMDRQHYFATPVQLAEAIRLYLQILESYNTFRPPYVYDIFKKIRQKMTTLDAAGMEAKIEHEEDRYKRRISNDARAYHALLQQYTEQLHTVLELSEVEMNSLTQFDNTRDSEQGWELEWQNKVRMLLDLRSKFLTSTFRGGKLCYPPRLFHHEPIQEMEPRETAPPLGDDQGIRIHIDALLHELRMVAQD